jgi:hypothetical protein
MIIQQTNASLAYLSMYCQSPMRRTLKILQGRRRINKGKDAVLGLRLAKKPWLTTNAARRSMIVAAWNEKEKISRGKRMKDEHVTTVTGIIKLLACLATSRQSSCWLEATKCIILITPISTRWLRIMSTLRTLPLRKSGFKACERSLFGFGN